MLKRVPQTDKPSNAKTPWMTLQCGQQGQARAEEEGRDGVHLVDKLKSTPHQSPSACSI